MGDPAAVRVFINYRREDSAGHAGRLHDALSTRLAPAEVFMDVGGIELGVDFTTAIADAVGRCDVMLVLIGPRWITAKTSAGDRRLDQSDDYVVAEISAGLERDIRVIPVLIEGARMPRSEALPEQIRALARRNALPLDTVSWRTDLDALVSGLDRLVPRDVVAERPAPAPPAGKSPAPATGSLRAQETPPPRRPRTGQLGTTKVDIRLVLGGFVLFLLLVAGAIAVLLAMQDPSSNGDLGSTGSGTSTSSIEGVTTSVVGTGTGTSLTAAGAADLVRDLQRRATPALAIGAVTCPPGPYRVGQVMVCQMALEDATVSHRVEITGEGTISTAGTKLIVDTDVARKLLEAEVPGAVVTCGKPRIRQLDVGADFTCRAPTREWQLTLTPEGGLRVVDV